MDYFWLALLGGWRWYHFRGKRGALHNLFTLNARIVGNLEVILARLAAITWTCSRVIVQMVFGQLPCFWVDFHFSGYRVYQELAQADRP